MTKSHVEEISRVYAHILEDVAYAYPTLRAELAKDRARLERSVVQRGLHCFCEDLPAMGKHLDRCLSNSKYIPSGLPLSKRQSKGVPIPKFLGGLYLLVFDAHGDLKEDYDVQAIFFLRQILYAAKKAKVTCSRVQVVKEIDNFVAVDKALPQPEEIWEGEARQDLGVGGSVTSFSDNPRYLDRAGSVANVEIRQQLSTFLTNLDIVSGLVSCALGPYRFEEYRFKHGPGAISEVTGKTNKYSWRNWSPRLERAFPIAHCGFHNYASWVNRIDEMEIGSHEPASRLIDVPKTFTKPRLIAAEPSEHQWCQQNIWHYFCTGVRRSWISYFIRFTDQRRNQELCTRGSMDGSLATIDLSMASDRVTCSAVGALFRSNIGLLEALIATRTRFIKIDRLGESIILKLRKFSTMGSACTFPVESLLFLSVALASILTVRHLKPTLRNIEALRDEVAVFGDDIVIPIDSRELLVSALEVLDFKINIHKSYWNGKFRESCGVDAFGGVNVTPAYWRQLPGSGPDSYSSTVDTSNNFYQKFLVSTSSYLESTIDRRMKPPVVAYDSGYCGVKSFVKPQPGTYTVRWNGALQRTECKVPQLSSRQVRTPITDDSALLQFFTEDPNPATYWRGGVEQRPVLRLKNRWVGISELTSSLM